MNASIVERILYILDSGKVLMIMLALVGVASFYFVFSVWLKIIAYRKEKVSSMQVSAMLREIKILKVLASCAPMLGLLGTIIGIGECIASAEDNVAVSKGISYALLTTQTGLILAIPAWVSAILLSKRLNGLLLDCK